MVMTTRRWIVLGMILGLLTLGFSGYMRIDTVNSTSLHSNTAPPTLYKLSYLAKFGDYLNKKALTL